VTNLTTTFAIPVDRELWEVLGLLTDDLPRTSTIEVFIRERTAQLVVVGPDSRTTTPPVPFEGDPDGLPEVVAVPIAVAVAGYRQASEAIEASAAIGFSGPTVTVTSSAGRGAWPVAGWDEHRPSRALAASLRGPVEAAGEVDGRAVLRCLFDVTTPPAPAAADTDLRYRLAVSCTDTGLELRSTWSDGQVVSSSTPWADSQRGDGGPASTEVWAAPLAAFLRATEGQDVRVELLEGGAVRLGGAGIEAVLADTTPRPDWDAALEQLGPHLVDDHTYVFEALGIAEDSPSADDSFRVELRTPSGPELLTVGIPIPTTGAQEGAVLSWAAAHGHLVRGGRLRPDGDVVWAESDVMDPDDLGDALRRLRIDAVDLCEAEGTTPPWFPIHPDHFHPTTGGI
jgi:hypothetical protein